MAMRAFWQDDRRTKSVRRDTSPRTTHNLDTENWFVHLGHPDFQEAGLRSKMESGAGSEGDKLSNELQVQNLPETLPSPVSAVRKRGAETTCFEVHEKQSEKCWS